MYFQTASLPGNLDRTLLTARKHTNFIPKKVARSVQAWHFRSYRSLYITHNTLATLYGLSLDLCLQSISILEPAPPMCLCVRVQNCEALQTAHGLNSDCLVVGLRFAYKRRFSNKAFLGTQGSSSTQANHFREC